MMVFLCASRAITVGLMVAEECTAMVNRNAIC